MIWNRGYTCCSARPAGGDFIAPLADRILGQAAAERRSEQAEWKERVLRAATEQFGYASRCELSSLISSHLRLHGAPDVRPANVHYWVSSKCIRPRKREDFTAILSFAGLQDRDNELWVAMGNIDRAHRRAGHFIRRMLLQKIAQTSLEPLERDGEMDFELGDGGGGSLSAYQVMAVESNELEVPVEGVGVLLGRKE